MSSSSGGNGSGKGKPITPTSKRRRPPSDGSKTPKTPQSKQTPSPEEPSKTPPQTATKPTPKTSPTEPTKPAPETPKPAKSSSNPPPAAPPPKPEKPSKEEAKKETTEPEGDAKPKEHVNPLRLLHFAQKGEWTVLDQTLRALEKGSPEVQAKDQDTRVTVLMLAVRENRLVIAERLIDLGANVNDVAKDRRTALHYAAAYAKDDMVRLLLNRKADATLTGGAKHQLPVHMACCRSSGVITMVTMLLKAAGSGCRLAEDKDGAIPLLLATESGNTSVCRELLTQQSDHQIKVTKRSNGDTVLHMACRRKDHELVKLFVENAIDVNAQNHEGLTALHITAWEGDDVLLKYLHQVKANPNIIDKMDRSPLHIAAEKGHTGIVELLVDKFRANVSARTKDGSTLMHIASMAGHPDTAMAFLKKGVPLHMPNKAGALCLHAAAQKGHVAVIKSLLTKGAPVDSRTKDNYTALHIAVEHCKPLAIQTLLGFGAQVELKGGAAKETPLHIAAHVKDGEKCAEMLLKSGADVNATQENGETALHIAARNGQLKMVQALLAEGADPMWQSKSGENALHISVRYCHWEVGDALLSFVKENKSHVDAVMLVNMQNTEGETPVHYAAELTKQHAHHEFEDTDMIRQLLEYDGDTNIATRLTQETPIHYCARAGNADILLEIVKYIGPNKTQTAVNKQAKNGWSPLLVASEHGHLSILQILLKHNARVDVFDEHGKAALHLSAENGHDEVADILLRHKAFVNAKSKVGVTPLHLAAQNGYNNLVKLLVQEHKATIDALSLAKKTPLHMAAQNGQMEVCNTLLNMKADANATDVHGQTPLHLAGENDHSDVVKLFLKHRPELVTMANTNGMTCAHIAASKGSVAVVKELMRFNKVVVTTARNRMNDSTALHLAAAGGHGDVVQALLAAGASPTDENGEGNTAVHLAAKYGHSAVLDVLREKMSLKVTSTKTGLTALHVAAHCGQMEFCREMLSQVPATIRSEPPHSPDAGPLSVPPDMAATEHGLTPLHLAAQSGHEGLVRLLLNSSGVQVDAATAVHGSIPLHLAAQSGHTAVVSLLLSKSTSQIHGKDKRGRTGLHMSAANGHIDMISLMLGQGAEINGYDKNGWTALHFAAKAGHLKVVQTLVEGGANPKYETKDGKVPLCFAAAANHADVLSYLLKKEHDTHSLMEDKKFVFDLMMVGKMNENMSIQEFILVSKAPVETAVKLSRHFRILAIKEKERSKDILLAGDFCEAMATELNSIAAASNSAGTLLKSVDGRGMQFLDVLIECEQKEVVSHPSVQKYLSEVWTGHLAQWGSFKMLLLFMALLFIPPVWLAFSMPVKHRFNRVPVIKFMSYLVSHIYLIALFVLVIVYPLYPLWESGSLMPHWYEWILLAWLSGLLVSQLTNPQDRAGLGWIKVVIIGISNIGVLIHFLAFAFSAEDRIQCLYVRNQFFGFALMLCFVQLLDFLSFHHLFGPWAIIIRDLLKDLIRFLVILAIFVLGFALHMSAVYLPVLPPLDPNANVGDGDGSGGTIVETPLDTLEILFFALFGLVEPENLPPVHRNPVWTITLVKAIFGIYLVLTLIVLINLLIAMMSDTYQRIQAQSDTEWKFGRAKLFRNMNKTSATPSPLNLFTKLFVYIKVLVKHRGKACAINDQQFVDEEEDLDTPADNTGLDFNTSGAGGGHSWLARGSGRAKVAPLEKDGFLAQARRGPVKIEDVIDWRPVVEKFLRVSGQTTQSDDDATSADTASSPDRPLKMEANGV